MKNIYKLNEQFLKNNKKARKRAKLLKVMNAPRPKAFMEWCEIMICELESKGYNQFSTEPEALEIKSRHITAGLAADLKRKKRKKLWQKAVRPQEFKGPVWNYKK